MPKQFFIPALLLVSLTGIVWIVCQFNPPLFKIASSEILDRLDDLIWVARGRPGLDDKVILVNKVPLGEYYWRIGQFTASRLIYREAIRDCQALGEYRTKNIGTLMRGMARASIALGHDWQAERLLKDAIAIHTEQGSFEDDSSADCEEAASDMCILGSLYRKQAKYGESKQVFTKALETVAPLQGATLIEPTILYELATLNVSQANYEEAARFYKLAQGETANDPSVMMEQIALARAYILKSKFDQARSVVKNCLTKNSIRDLVGQYCLVGPSLNNCAILLEKFGKAEDAAMFRSYAKEIEGDWHGPENFDIW